MINLLMCCQKWEERLMFSNELFCQLNLTSERTLTNYMFGWQDKKTLISNWMHVFSGACFDACVRLTDWFSENILNYETLSRAKALNPGQILLLSFLNSTCISLIVCFSCIRLVWYQDQICWNARAPSHFLSTSTTITRSQSTPLLPSEPGPVFECV